MLKRNLNAKQHAELLFSKNESFLKSLLLTKKASPLAIVSVTSLAVFRLFPLFIQAVQKEKDPRFFEKILEEYEHLLKKWYLGETLALVKTAIPLSSEEKEELIERLAAIFGRYLKLEIEVDPELIGGLLVKVGDKVIDRSFLKKLKRLKEHIQS